jgi:hypothetical protein
LKGGDAQYSLQPKPFIGAFVIMALMVRRISILTFACTTALSVATSVAPAQAAGEGKKRAEAPQSLEARHQKCLAFVRRHGATCDPWVEPTCGADSGYFRPPECVRPRPK